MSAQRLATLLFFGPLMLLFGTIVLSIVLRDSGGIRNFHIMTPAEQCLKVWPRDWDLEKRQQCEWNLMKP
jgi:hypothetical protein